MDFVKFSLQILDVKVIVPESSTNKFDFILK